MRKFELMIVGLLMASSTSTFAQLSFGVKAGLNLTNMTVKSNSEKETFSSKFGYNAGGFADYSISDLLGIETSLNVEMKGYQINNEFKGVIGNYTETIKKNLVYVTIPIDAKLSFGSFYILGGPYLGIAATGKTKTKQDRSGDDYKHTEKVEFGNEKGKSSLKRVDLGVGFGVGYEINNHIGIRMGYDLGLANLQPGGDKNNSLKNGSFNTSATYKF